MRNLADPASHVCDLGEPSRCQRLIQSPFKPEYENIALNIYRKEYLKSKPKHSGGKLV